MTGAAFERLFDGPARQPESKLTQREMDLARSVQDVTEEAMIGMARHARRQTGLSNLCLAGGVALNCVGNGRMLREGVVDEIWIQPAAGDAGGALGVAMNVWHRFLGQPRVSPEQAGTWAPRRSASGRPAPYADGMNGAFLGPRFTGDEIQRFVDGRGLPATRLPPAVLADRIAALLAEEKVIGLFQGRMEFGPRALGARSIIGDARSPKMQSVMNLKIKFRESFRPFAPAVLRERVADWFDMDADSPYMLLVADVRADRRLPLPPGADALWGIEQLNVARSTIPAVTHVDHSARIQTVRRETNPLYYDILERFHARTGCPVIVNTSFNVRGEPIVCTPEDAYRCFMRTDMDVLVLETFLLFKDQQTAVAADETWKQEFVLD
jgi:carbamoyltransferase